MDRKVFEIALARLGVPGIAVARELGVHHTTLSRWVRGWYEVPAHLRPRLAEVLEVQLEELFPKGGDGAPR